MTVFDPEQAKKVLITHKASLGGDASEIEQYLREATSRLEARGPDDRREATKLAVETAKMILTISVGVLVAVGTFVQFAHNGGVPWASMPNVLFLFAALVLLFSMICGFSAISRAYKRADGREAPSEPAWATKPLASLLNRQAFAGIFGLVFLVGGLVTWPISLQVPQSLVAITLTRAATSQLHSGPLLIDGLWSELRFKSADDQEVKLAAKTGPISVSCNW